MTRSTAYLLAAVATLSLAACGPRANDNASGSGAETGAAGSTGGDGSAGTSSYDSTSALTPSSTLPGATTPPDTGAAGRDTTAR
jgi:hypothetical protein